MLTDERILGMVVSDGADLDVANRQPIARANQAGGRDDIGAILVRLSA